MRNLFRSGLAAVFSLTALAASLPAAALSDRPVPGSADWKDIYAVDLANNFSVEKPKVDLTGAKKLSVTYKGKFAGLNIGRIWIDSWLTDDAYRLKYKMEQEGIARWFSKASANSDSWGLLGADKQTALYYYNYDFEAEDDYQHVEMTRSGPDARFRLFSDPQYEFWHPVPFQLAKDTVDPMSALVQLGFLQVAPGENPCNRTVEVFDGRRRFNMRMIADGEVTLKLRGTGRYQGPAWRCKVYQDKIAGYREKDLVEKEQKDAWVFLAPVPETAAGLSLSYFPVLLEGKMGGLRASLEAKYPTVTLADGTEVKLYRD